MRNLATDGISNKVLKTLFLQKMPDSICNILIISAEDIEKLALMADRIIEMQAKQELYSTSSIVSPGADAITELPQQIASLIKKLEKLSVTRNSPPRSRKRTKWMKAYCIFFFSKKLNDAQ
ncbi:hypothetical protein X975_01020, partial [Stegodyphus mimosarum]